METTQGEILLGEIRIQVPVGLKQAVEVKRIGSDLHTLSLRK